MANKQIVIDYKTLCENYSKEIGCLNTFDGSCSKEDALHIDYYSCCKPKSKSVKN